MNNSTDDLKAGLDDRRIKHLELIQGVITRMANNSFMLKGWSLTVVTGILALGAAAPGNHKLLWLIGMPVFLFWCLDGYYLWQERLFRRLYDDVRTSPHPVNFSMNTEDVKERRPSYIDTLRSGTVSLFHLGICILTPLVGWLLGVFGQGVK